MGGLGKLSDFGGKSSTTVAVPEPVTPAEEPINTPELKEEAPPTPKKTKRASQKKPERLVTVNIKILESQQEWLADTAKQVRQNNDSPVPANERVYPQHLIQVAVDLLKSSDVDWENVRNVEELRNSLKL